MKSIAVQEQVRLGPARCLALSITGMSYRLFRSVVTVAILTLAVAFLAHILTYGVIEHRTLLAVQDELRDHRLLGAWVVRLSGSDPETTVEGHLAGEAGLRLSEYKGWSGLDEAGFDEVRGIARRVNRAYAYFGSLPVTARAILTVGLEPREVVARLSGKGQLSAFMRHLDELKLDPPLGDRKAFEALIREDVPKLRQCVSVIRQRQREGARSLSKAFGKQSPLELLANRPDGLEEALARAGFRLPGEVLQRLSVLAKQRVRFNWLADAITLPGANAEIASELGIERTRVNVSNILALTSKPAKAKWLSDLLKRHSGESGVTAEEVLALSAMQRRLNRLQGAAGDRPPVKREGGVLVLTGSTGGLILLSFLVCTVGVANAMFMSVTERFAEIATMKCLGALDGFLMILFLFESGIQGLVGALAGVVLGVGLALLRGFALFGGLLAFPLVELLVGSGLCIVAGVVLAVVGGVGPAWAAARLAPMEAMRIE